MRLEQSGELVIEGVGGDVSSTAAIYPTENMSEERHVKKEGDTMKIFSREGTSP